MEGREETEVAGVEAERDIVEEEEEDETPLLEEVRRWKAAGLGGSAAGEGEEAWKAFHDFWISSSSMGCRRSRFADRASKAWRQCSGLAMLSCLSRLLWEFPVSNSGL